MITYSVSFFLQKFVNMYYGGMVILLYVILFLFVGRGFGKNCYQFTSSSSSITYYPVTPNEINITECNMKAATHVYLRGNGALFWSLETLPLYMFDGTNVQSIDSYSVGLQYLHNGIFQPIKRSLKYIVMENNLFYNFPSNAFYGLEELQEISMKNQLGKGMKRCYFPPGLGLRSLKNIYLSGNQLETAEFYDLKTEHIKTLDLDSNALTVLDLSEVYNIRYLQARQNRLENITETSFLHSRQSLQYLYLSNNRLTSLIWSSLVFTNNLRQLDLRKNNISFVKPLVINMLTNLTWIDLSQNSIMTLRDVQFRNNKLTHLLLNGNNLKNLPNYCVSSTSFADPWSYGIFDISGNELQGSVSLTIPKCNDGCNIDLSRNSISEFILHFPTETKLYLLNISYNKLRKIQTHWPLVYHFDISRNELEGSVSLTLPTCNGYCNIDLSMNKITDFTLQYQTDTKLDLLNISYNKLRKIQEHWPPVKRFDISHNRFNSYEILRLINSSLGMVNQIELENIGLFCDKEFNIEDDLELEFDNLDSINLGGNCIPLELLCRMKFKESYKTTKIILDKNIMNLGKTVKKFSTCASLADMKVSLSMNNMNSQSTDLIRLLFDHKTFLSRPLTSLWLRQNKIHSLQPLNLIYSTSKSSYTIVGPIQLDFRANELLVLPNMTISFENKNGALYSGSFDLNFARNLLTEVNQIHIDFKKVYTYYPMNCNINISRNHLIEVNSIVFLERSLSDYLFRYIFINIDLGFNDINTIDFKRCIQTSSTSYKLQRIDINLSHNQLSSLFNCDELRDSYFTKIDLSHNSIAQFVGCKRVHDLNLGYNKIRHIQEDFDGELLTTLNLEHNLIKSIPILAFNRSTSIRTLTLKDNLLQEIPEAILKLRNLQHFDISFNKIQIVNNVNLFRELPNLRTLILTRNDFIPTVSEGTLPTHDNALHCDCNFLLFRNITFEVQGRCVSPPEIRGYHVSCFPLNTCPRLGPLFVQPSTIAKCQSDVFPYLTLNLNHTINSQESPSAFNTVSITIGSCLLVSVVVNCIALLFVLKHYRSQSSLKTSHKRTKTTTSTASEMNNDSVNQEDHIYDRVSDTKQNRKIPVPKHKPRGRKENLYEMSESRTEMESSYVNTVFST